MLCGSWGSFSRSSRNVGDELTTTNEMQQKILVLILVFFCNLANSQMYIVGDTSSKYLAILNDTLSDQTMDIDIDCDNVMDLQFVSHLGGKFAHDWQRLSFYMDSSTQVANGQVGAVSRYEIGDTILLDSNIWTHNLNFIFGVGGLGTYGWNKIDTDFIMFRKIGISDTSYAFFEISTLGARMKIHRIISSCQALYIITQNQDYTIQKNIVYPNPFTDIIQCNFSFKELLIYDFSGRTVKITKNARTVDVATLPIGVYILVIKNENDEIRRFKMEKN